MGIDPDSVRRYADPERWRVLAAVKREAWLARWRRGPATQIRSMADLRAFAHTVRGPPSADERDEDLAHHVRMSELMRRVDAADR